MSESGDKTPEALLTDAIEAFENKAKEIKNRRNAGRWRPKSEDPPEALTYHISSQLLAEFLEYHQQSLAKLQTPTTRITQRRIHPLIRT